MALTINYRSNVLNTKCISAMIAIIFVLSWCQFAFGQPTDFILVWGKREKQESNIYFTRKKNQVWDKPEQLSFSPYPEVTPTLVSNPTGDVWVVWTELSTTGGKLHYRRYNKGSWRAPQTVETTTTSDMAPSSIIDRHGDIWLVWAGTDGKDDDIFSSRWNRRRWGEPMKVNSDDNLPDILPKIDLNSNGNVRVSWVGYVDGKYRNFHCDWTGDKWGPERLSGELMGHRHSNDSSADVDTATIISSLPDFVDDINQAAIHFLHNGHSKTVHLKDIQ